MFSNKDLRRVLFFVICALLALFSPYVGFSGNASAASTNSTVTAAGYQQSSPTTSYKKIDQYGQLGEVVNWAVGASSTGQGQQIYISYKYYNGSFDLVEADPFTGNFRVHTSPIANEWGANAEVTGPDGNIYLGTLPHAHWVKYSPATDTMTDLGAASSTEQYIWAATTGADHNIYGVTYPHAKLVRLDPITQKITDLGSMDPTQQYARYIAASADGFIYIGIGSAASTVVAYNIATGQHKAIVPYYQTGFANVYAAIDNKLYAKLPDGTSYTLSGWTATQIPVTSLSAAKPVARLNDGSVVGASGNQISVYPSGQRVSHTISYTGKGVDIFRLALGPDGNLYGSTILPAYLITMNIAKTAPSTSSRIATLGTLNYAQVYSFMSDTKKLYMAGYGYNYPLATANLSPTVSAGSTLTYNSGYTYADWRPTAMIQGSDNNIYIGGIPGYGKLGGSLVKWNTGSGTTQAFSNVVTDQSIYSLTMANGKVVGGTTIFGGYGSTPTQSRAKLFVWDPVTNSNVYETIPTSNATYVSNLITAPNGLVYGFANSTLFIFDPVSRKITLPGYALPVNTYVYNLYNNMAMGSDGNIWGLSTTGVYKIDLSTNKVTIFPSPVTITGGFALAPDKVNGDSIYFASHADLYKFQVSDGSGSTAK
jgi:hypothetical protein